MFPKSVEGQPCEFEHSTCAGKNEGCQARRWVKGEVVLKLSHCSVSKGQGPFGWNDFANTREIGSRQAVFAQQLWASATTPLSGSTFGFVHTYVDMSNVTGWKQGTRVWSGVNCSNVFCCLFVAVSPQFTISGNVEYTCPGGLGDSFAAGTTDGPGDFNFVEGCAFFLSFF